MRRIRQFELHRDDEFRLDFARRVVAAKIGNGRVMLNRMARNGHGDELHNSAKCLKDAARKAKEAANVDILRGIEGSAAARYFGALRCVLPDDLAFGNRARRPAPDAVNALLNLGYTLAGHELWTALESCGLDPYLGLFHVEKLGRPALALDLLEEFRAPLVDRLALALFNTRTLQTSDFECVDGEMRLRPAALKTFLAAYEAAVSAPFTDARSGERVSFRRLFLMQSRRLARAIEGGEAYWPYRHK